MTIATLIAAGRLDDSLIEAAMDRLADSGMSSGTAGWIDRGAAIDLDVEGEGAAIRAALHDWPGDVVTHGGARAAPRLFVADMDSTMIGQECIDELADYAGCKGEVAAVTERAMRGELDFGAALEVRVGLLAGLDQAVFAQCLAERIVPTAGAATLVGTLRAKGVATILVTGGFTALAEPLARRLGFGEVHANVLEIAEGKLTGRTLGPVIDGAAKAAVLERRRSELNIERGQTVAIGDGANDILMIRAAGLGLGFRPKPALAEVADGSIRHHGLEAVLWALGIPRREWVVGD